MTKEDYIRLGFEPMEHYTVADALLYQLGRNRHISAGCVGTPNEMLWLCQRDDKDPRITTDLVCLHNWDYDKEMTEEKLMLLIKALSGGGDKSTESGGENGVLHDVSHSCSPLNTHDQLLIEKVIELLKCKRDFFSAKWFTGKSLDSSIQSQDKNILIMIETGQIAQPTRPKMTKHQKEVIKQLVAPIVEKDSKYLIEKLIRNCG